MRITLYTSGSTAESKLITHEAMEKHINRSVIEMDLRPSDIVLDIFPSNVIAHYTVTAQPAIAAGAHLITAAFNPYNYVQLFNQYRPTVIALIPKHIEVLEKIKGWHELDMSCVRYMVTGSQQTSQTTIDSLRAKGVATVANWYGMTEMPPPIFVGYNSTAFDFTPKYGYSVEFTDEGECVINGIPTGDIFDLATKTFSHRRNNATNSTWKTL
jgi:acyl-coenzyme A synthetase/AMP-(fatty) acid ligase